MNFKKLALGLLFGGALAAGAVACGGESTGSTGSATGTTTGATTGATTGTPGVDVSGCDPASDPDTGTATARITHLSLPNNAGFNLDNINNASAPAGMGSTIAGCGKVDITGGIDNALAGIATSLMSVIDLNKALQDALRHTLPDGGMAGSLDIDVTGTHMAANNAANDSCIGVDVTVAATGVATQTYHGRGILVNNVANVVFDNAIDFTVSLEVPSASCTNNMCNPGSLTIQVRGARALATFNAAHTDVQAGSLIGGYIFFQDCTGTTVDSNTTLCNAGGDYGSLNPTGFGAALNAYATQVNLASSFKTMAINAFSGARDLHMGTDGTLSACTGANTASVNKNSVSVALAVDTL